MAATPQAIVPYSGAGSLTTGDCLQCNALRSLLTQCGSCGGTQPAPQPSPSPLPTPTPAPSPAPGSGGTQPAPQPSPSPTPATGACPAGYTAINGTCEPNPLPIGANQDGCPQGYNLVNGACEPNPAPGTSPSTQPAPQTAPQAVEACFVCPGGLTELSAALAGQPNGCYLASQMFFPAGAQLPAPGQ
jgi:hypothetical protein